LEDTIFTHEQVIHPQDVAAQNRTAARRPQSFSKRHLQMNVTGMLENLETRLNSQMPP
jgi:hypothetical protein